MGQIRAGGLQASGGVPPTWARAGSCRGLTSGPQKYMSPEPMNITLLGQRVFSDVIKNPEMAHPRLSWALNPMTSVLKGDRREDPRERPREDRGGDWRDRTTSQGPRGTATSWKRQEGAFPRAPGVSTARGHLDFGLQTSGTVRTSVVSSSPVCGHLLRSPQDTNVGSLSFDQHPN